MGTLRIFFGVLSLFTPLLTLFFNTPPLHPYYQNTSYNSDFYNTIGAISHFADTDRFKLTLDCDTLHPYNHHGSIDFYVTNFAALNARVFTFCADFLFLTYWHSRVLVILAIFGHFDDIRDIRHTSTLHGHPSDITCHAMYLITAWSYRLRRTQIGS